MAKSSRKKRNTNSTTKNSNSRIATTSPNQSATMLAQSTNTTTASEKSKIKKVKTKKGRRVKKKTNYTPWIIGALVLVAVLAYPQIQRQYLMRTASGDFAQFVRQGAGDVRNLQVRHRDLGRSHVPFGSDINYNSIPPTTGPHYGSWINPGYYVEEQEPKQLVHSLEHGHGIVKRFTY